MQSLPEAPSQSIATRNVGAEEIVRQFVAAYNRKDLGGMMALASDDIQWHSVEGDKTTIMTDGAEAMRAELAGHLGPDDDPRSVVEILKSHGNFVTTLERAYWTVNGAEKSQASFAVYEVNEGAVRRVWYFPASP